MKGLDNNVEQAFQIAFDLKISAQEYLKYYRGEVKWVIVRSLCGKKVRFPANLLVNHVSHDGIEGRFVLHYLAGGKAIKLAKMAAK
jgi:hypothetical protein